MYFPITVSFVVDDRDHEQRLAPEARCSHAAVGEERCAASDRTGTRPSALASAASGRQRERDAVDKREVVLSRESRVGSVRTQRHPRLR